MEKADREEGENRFVVARFGRKKAVVSISHILLILR